MTPEEYKYKVECSGCRRKVIYAEVKTFISIKTVEGIERRTTKHYCHNCKRKK